MAFPYVKTTWVSGGAPGIDAPELNNLETQFDSVLALLTTRGDLPYRGASTWERLPKGTAGQFLQQGASDPAWANVLPTGIICMWHGLLANIPTGWVLCNGSSGTPDLRDKFVVGAPNATNPGTTGGALNKTTAGHTHGGKTGYLSDLYNPIDGSGEPAGTSGTKSDHKHTIASGTDSIADIRPPYYEIAFIMKT